METERSSCHGCVSFCRCCQVLVVVLFLCFVCLTVLVLDGPEFTVELNNITENVTLEYILYMKPNTILASQLFTTAPAVGLLGVYWCLPELRNLQGKILMSYVASCAAVKVVELVLYKCSDNARLFSIIFIYALLTFGFAQFTWVTLMCFDISATFSRPLQGSLEQNHPQHRQFLKYSTCGWGLPLLYLLLPDGLQIMFTALSVFTEAILCMMMFVSTLVDLRRHRHSSRSLRRHGTADPDWLVNLKLAFLMILESSLFFVETFLDFGIFSTFLEYFLTFQGTILFVLLVCKKRVLELLLKKLPERLTNLDS